MAELKWIGHASFFFDAGGKRAFIDPFNIKADFGKADIIFITHSHFDHLDINSIKKIADESTAFVVPLESKQKIPYKKVTALKPGEDGEILGIRFRTLPAYNTKPERLNFHPRANGWLGYIINAEGISIYHAGDTDFIEEMKGISVDTALIPMGGTYTMDVGEAANAALSMKARRVAPMHYKALLGKEGSAKAERDFKAKVSNAVIMKEEQEPSYSF